MATFGERMRSLRNEKDITLDELAINIQSTKATLSRYENSIRTPNIDFAKKAAEYFGVSVDYMMCNTDDKDLKKQKPSEVSAEDALAYQLADEVTAMCKRLNIIEIKALKSILEEYSLGDLKLALTTLEQFAQLKKK